MRLVFLWNCSHKKKSVMPKSRWTSMQFAVLLEDFAIILKAYYKEIDNNDNNNNPSTRLLLGLSHRPTKGLTVPSYPKLSRQWLLLTHSASTLQHTTLQGRDDSHYCSLILHLTLIVWQSMLNLMISYKNWGVSSDKRRQKGVSFSVCNHRKYCFKCSIYFQGFPLMVKILNLRLNLTCVLIGLNG